MVNLYKSLRVGLCVFGIIVIIIAILGVCGMIFNNGKSNVLNIQLQNSYIIDTTGIREKMHIVDGTPSTFFLQLKHPDDSKAYLLKEFNLEVSKEINDIGGEDKYLIITIGRKLESVLYKFQGKPYLPRTFATADIVFSEKYYDQMMYVYTTDRVLLASSIIGGNTFYIKDGTNQKILGHTIEDINVTKPCGKGGV